MDIVYVEDAFRWRMTDRPGRGALRAEEVWES